MGRGGIWRVRWRMGSDYFRRVNLNAELIWRVIYPPLCYPRPQITIADLIAVKDLSFLVVQCCWHPRCDETCPLIHIAINCWPNNRLVKSWIRHCNSMYEDKIFVLYPDCMIMNSLKFKRTAQQTNSPIPVPASDPADDSADGGRPS